MTESSEEERSCQDYNVVLTVGAGWSVCICGGQFKISALDLLPVPSGASTSRHEIS